MIFELPGGEEIEKKFGPCLTSDFTEVRILSVETYYEEDNEQFEKSLNLILRGEKGTIEFNFQNVQDFSINNISDLGTFQVINISDKQLDSKKYFFFDEATESISGYCEFGNVSICENQFV